VRVRSVDPATLETVTETDAANAEAVGVAVAAARAAQPAWAAVPLRERLARVGRFGEVLLARDEAVARLVSREMGKPIPEAYASDLLPTLDAVDWLVSRAAAVLEPGPFRLRNPILLDRRSQVKRAPRGVVGIIGPWNYPFSLPAIPSLFALAAGNAVVLKPSEQTTGTGLLVAEIARAAGFPEDALRVVPGPGEPTGAALVEADVDHLVFTGSCEVGARIGRRMAERGVGCSLELGGSDPALVLADADLDVAANGILWGRFTNAGQTCAAVKRVLVHESVHDALVERLVDGARRLRLGRGLEAETDVGPLVDERAAREMETFVQDAVKRGARVLCGGARPPRQGWFFEPTVLVDVPRDARVLHEEVFGPVLPVVRCRDEDEMIEAANGTPFGLSASVWTRDVERGRTLALRLDAGTVTVNDAAYTYAATETPWGGVKASGRGRTHGVDGLLDLTVPRHVNWAPGRRRLAELWWFPYEADLAPTWRRALRWLYGGAAGKARASGALTTALLRKRNLRFRP